MSTTCKGSCSCGAIKVEIQGDPLFASLCHCHTCQKTTSSAFSTNWFVPKSNFTIASGEPTTYEGKGGSGNPTFRKFCGTCSSTLWIESPLRPDVVIIKAGIMDDGGIGKFKPSVESFISRKPEWVQDVEGATQFNESVPVQPKQ